MCMLAWLIAMSKAAVKISADLLSNPLCEQDPAFLEYMTALDTAMRRMDSFNQEKVSFSPTLGIFTMSPFMPSISSLSFWHSDFLEFVWNIFSSNKQSGKLDKGVFFCFFSENACFHICQYCAACGLKTIRMSFLLLFLKSICGIILYKLKLLVISCENWCICDSLVSKITHTMDGPSLKRKTWLATKFTRVTRSLCAEVCCISCITS